MVFNTHNKDRGPGEEILQIPGLGGTGEAEGEAEGVPLYCSTARIQWFRIHTIRTQGGIRGRSGGDLGEGVGLGMN